MNFTFIIIFCFTEPNIVEKLLILLKECNISRPDMTVVYKIAKSSNILQYACLNVDNAYSTYLEYKDLPATFTCEFVAKALELNLNGPSLGDNKPFILSATNKNGQQLMVKLLRMDSSIRKIDELVIRNITPSTIYLWKEALPSFPEQCRGIMFELNLIKKASALKVVVILIHKVQSEGQSLSEMRKSVCFVMRMESVEI